MRSEPTNPALSDAEWPEHAEVHAGASRGPEAVLAALSDPGGGI